MAEWYTRYFEVVVGLLVGVRVPLSVNVFCLTGCSSVWKSACFGSMRPGVRAPPPGPIFFQGVAKSGIVLVLETGDCGFKSRHPDHSICGECGVTVAREVVALVVSDSTSGFPTKFIMGVPLGGNWTPNPVLGSSILSTPAKIFLPIAQRIV